MKTVKITLVCLLAITTEAIPKVRAVNATPAIRATQAETAAATIDISHLPSGTYFVKLKTATEELTKKVIKE